MKKQRSPRILAATAFLFGIAVSTALADQDGPAPSYSATTPDGKHVFRIIDSYEVGKPYPASGMYLNDGSTVPLWTVDWDGFAFVPSGGQYVVRKGPWAQWSGSYSEEALTFFSNGQPLKTYTTSELIDFPWLLPHTVAHYGWQPIWTPNESDAHPSINVDGTRYSSASVTFDDQHQHVHMQTVLGDQLTFDLRTGEIVSAKRMRAMTTYGMFAILLTAYIAWRIMYAGTSLNRPLLTPSNVIVGGAFTLGLIVVPTTAAQFFRELDPSAGESYASFISMGFETLPRYVVAFFGVQRPEITPSGSALVVCFWLAALATFTGLDRVVVWTAERARWRRV